MPQNIVEFFEKSLDVTSPYLKTILEESSEIEFKKSLHTKSDSIDKQYLRTISGFANNIGGTIIFGIAPDNNEIIGIKAEQANLDNRYFSTTINSGLDGCFTYRFSTKAFLGKIVGFLEIERAISKPIIMKTDADVHKLGEIYYRYPAQTTKILSADLRRILNEEIANGLQSMMGNISKLIEVGNNAAILDVQTGIIDGGPQMPKFILDEKILENINIIKLGQFVEKEGSPAYVIKGEIETGNIEFIEKTVLSNIYEEDIINYFAKGECDVPELVLERQLSLASHYFPVHFFVRALGYDPSKTLEYLSSFDNKEINPRAFDKIKERLASRYNYGKQGVIFYDIKEKIDNGSIDEANIKVTMEKYSKPASAASKAKRTLIYNTLVNFRPITDELLNDHTTLLIEALSNIGEDCLLQNKKYFMDLIGRINAKPGFKRNTLFKKMICFCDEVYYNQFGVLQTN
ncbi:helix-turn-helix domain-containing protein [Pedobacter sp. GR22-10]|uniref:AlbA family DNA-binding domain-containing protein n=1 Tax=Pedobacter sp. GR22-10 TaxID=2994472 RepID=UPI0022458EE2|nr:ATP-binding protein [Pedobacter sp. GR22-10]MCX2432188.1 ATP-binding protein [Pedobacter sp. GR22-10]